MKTLARSAQLCAFCCAIEGKKIFTFFSKSSRKIKSAQINLLLHSIFSKRAVVAISSCSFSSSSATITILLLPRVKDGTVDGVEIGEEGIVIVVVVVERRFVFAEEKAQKRLTE